MIRLKNLLSEISLMTGDASESDMKSMFDKAFTNGILPKKYRTLYYADGDEAKSIPKDYLGRDLTRKDTKEMEKFVNLNRVTPQTIKFLNKYESVGKSGGYTMILKKKGSDLEFMLCDTGAEYLTEFFIGVIKVTKGADTYNFTPDKAFNLKTYQIHWSNIASEHKGMGLGRLMYKMVYEYITGPLNAALVSDSTLFEGSQKMWMQFIPDIASFFGIVVQDVFFPIDRSEIGSSVMGNNVDMMVAMESVPTQIRKIAHNVKGLSFKSGEYGVLRVREDINKKIPINPNDSKSDYHFDEDKDMWIATKKKTFPYTHFSNLVDEATTLFALIKQMERLDFNMRDIISNTDNISDLRACVFSFNNVNVIVKQMGGKLVMVPV